MKNKYQNTDICTECGGSCCKSFGCHYSPDDFLVITKESLRTEIDKGYISIDWWDGDIDGNEEYDRIYYLRIKNCNSRIVDPSWGGQCSIWDKDKGCPFTFEQRPKGGRMVVPNPRYEEEGCKTEYDKEMCAREWRPYYNILSELRMIYQNK